MTRLTSEHAPPIQKRTPRVARKSCKKNNKENDSPLPEKKKVFPTSKDNEPLTNAYTAYLQLQDAEDRYERLSGLCQAEVVFDEHCTATTCWGPEDHEYDDDEGPTCASDLGFASCAIQ